MESTRRKGCTSRLAMCLAGATMTMFPAAFASRALAGSEELPSGESILERYVEVTGGKAAYQKIKNRVVHGTFAVAVQGMEGKMESYSAAPAKSYLRIELGQMGAMEQGTDGDVAWQIHPMMGPRIRTGDERATALRQANFYAEINWRKAYKKVECVEKTEIDGRPCYKVVLTPRQGAEIIRYYDVETGLTCRLETEADTPMGIIPVTLLPSDYRVVDGLKIAFKTVQRAMGVEQIVTAEKIEHNVDIPADRFAIPDAIKALQHAEKKEAEADDAKPAGASAG